MKDLSQLPEPLQTLATILGVGDQRHVADHRSLARALSHAMLSSVASEPPYSDPLTINGGTLTVADLGAQLVDAMWPAEGAPAPDLALPLAEIETIADPEQRRAVSEMVARFGHLHQMAGLMLRDQVLRHADSPSTAASFLTGDHGSKRTDPYTDPAKAVAALNRPRLEFTFTAHPTNTNSLTSMQAQRRLGAALEGWKRGHGVTTMNVQRALKSYAIAPLLPQRPSGAPGFTVRTETDVMLNYLGNCYDDLDRIYGSYDKAFGNHFTYPDKPYRPQDLRLNVGLHSWGSSGDKDGNSNVNADTTLYALAAHHREIIGRYLASMESIEGLDDWRSALLAAHQKSEQVLGAVQDALDTDGHLDPALHDELRTHLSSAIAPLDQKTFLTDLEVAYDAAGEDHKPAILGLLRHVHTFGFSFGNIEYRETSEELGRIVEACLPGYEHNTTIISGGPQELLKPEIFKATQVRAKNFSLLNETLQDPEKLAAFRERLQELAQGQAGKAYSKSDVAPIAYHTLKRLELARDFPHAIKNHVLAECQGEHNFLELLLLQHASSNEQGQRATLGIVPLFEDSHALEAAPYIVGQALNSAPYKAHLQAIRDVQGTEPAQQVQLAHSDNARRNGMVAARTMIYKTHQRLRDMFAGRNDSALQTGQQPVELQFYEGGSLSDPYRGGVRSISAAINEFGLHEFSKMTAQGGDLLNYFNQPNAFFRLVTRNITHNAARIEAMLKDPNFMDYEGSHVGRVLAHKAGQTLPKTGEANETGMLSTLIATKDAYRDFFEGAEINDFLESIGMVEESRYGNASSRAADRPGAPTRLDVTQTRTITFSEGQQHSDLCPTWVGTKELFPTYTIANSNLLPQAANSLASRNVGAHSPTLLNHHYKNSPIFKDNIDRILFGLLRTDMDSLRERSGNHPLIAERLAPEYEGAFKMALEAYSGKRIEVLTGGRTLDAQAKRQLLVDTVYPHVRDVIEDQDRFGSVVRGMKRGWLPSDDGTINLGMTLHNAMDTVLHGRMPIIDDTTYAKLYCAEKDIALPFGPSRQVSSAR